jgi:hypothetical protein
MATAVYNIFKFIFSNGQVNLLTDTIKIMLVNSYSVDVDNHNYVSDISAYEVNGTGYTSGGMNLVNKAIIRNDVNDRTQFSATNVQWDNSSITSTGAIIYKDISSDKTISPLICYVDFGAIKQSVNTPFLIEWSAQQGIFYIT